MCSSTCFNGGTCPDPTINNCTCPRGYTGSLCETGKYWLFPILAKCPSSFDCFFSETNLKKVTARTSTHGLASTSQMRAAISPWQCQPWTVISPLLGFIRWDLSTVKAVYKDPILPRRAQRMSLSASSAQHMWELSAGKLHGSSPTACAGKADQHNCRSVSLDLCVCEWNQTLVLML